MTSAAAPSPSPICAAWFPQTADLAGNPYWPLLQQNLEALGVTLAASHHSYWTQRRWLWQQRRQVQVLHFHFIQPHYAAAARASLRRLRKFTLDLLLARQLGYRLVWTLHDFLPTWPLPPAWVERLARRIMAALAHDVIVHCEEGRRLLAQAFGRCRRVWTLPHPPFVEQLTPAVSRPAARAQLGLPAEAFVIGFVGGIRPNKGVEQLLAAFAQLGEERAWLLVAGRPWPPESYLTALRAQAAALPRVIFHPQEIPAAEMSLYLSAPDVLAFPFQRVLTSSTVIQALAAGRPVIAPRLGCLPELVGENVPQPMADQPGAGILYPPADPHGLLAALRYSLTADLPRMGEAGRERACAGSWPALARATLDIYHGTP